MQRNRTRIYLFIYWCVQVLSLLLHEGIYLFLPRLERERVAFSHRPRLTDGTATIAPSFPFTCPSFSLIVSTSPSTFLSSPPVSTPPLFSFATHSLAHSHSLTSVTTRISLSLSLFYLTIALVQVLSVLSWLRWTWTTDAHIAGQNDLKGRGKNLTHTSLLSFRDLLFRFSFFYFVCIYMWKVNDCDLVAVRVYLAPCSWFFSCYGVSYRDKSLLFFFFSISKYSFWLPFSFLSECEGVRFKDSFLVYISIISLWNATTLLLCIFIQPVFTLTAKRE